MYVTKVIDLYKEFDAGIDEAVKLIKAGDVVAFPTETVYGLGADATRSEAVRMIFAAKGRPADNPLIVHVCSAEQAVEVAHVTADAQKLMEAFWPGPLTIVLKKRKTVPQNVCAGLQTVAVRMPDDQAALELIYRSGVPIAAPSANISGRPSPTLAQHVLDDFNGKIPLILDGGRCEVGLESTVVELGEGPQILRPGAITPQMLCAVLGDVSINRGVLHDVSQQAASPGMKHKHYAPSAQVLLVEDGADQQQKAAKLYDKQAAANKKCIIFATKDSEAFYLGKNYVIIGDRSNMESLCGNIFAALRDADENKYDCIIVEALPAQGMGLAYMNRVLRAAGFALTD